MERDARFFYDKIAGSWYNIRHWTIFQRELEELNRAWRGGSLLNIGCAHGPDFLPFSSAKFSFFGLDSSRELVLLSKKYALKNGLVFKNLVGDMRRLPFRDSSADYIICTATLHHLTRKKDRLQALSEMRRVLRREAFITVWNRENPDLPDRETIKREWKFRGQTLARSYYLYTKEELERELRDVGFSAEIKADEKNITALLRLK